MCIGFTFGWLQLGGYAARYRRKVAEPNENSNLDAYANKLQYGRRVLCSSFRHTGQNVTWREANSLVDHLCLAAGRGLGTPTTRQAGPVVTLYFKLPPAWVRCVKMAFATDGDYVLDGKLSLLWTNLIAASTRQPPKIWLPGDFLRRQISCFVPTITKTVENDSCIGVYREIWFFLKLGR